MYERLKIDKEPY